MLDSSGDEPTEQRVGVRRARLELRMGLGGDEVRMSLAVEFHELRQTAVRRGAADPQTYLLEAISVGVVDLVAVPVTLGDRRRAIELGHQGILGELGGVGPQAHSAAQISLAGDGVDLLGHRRDDRVGGLWVKLTGGCVLDTGQVPGDLDNRALHAQAQAQEGHLVLAGVANGTDLALDPTDAESARDTDGVSVLELLCSALRGHAGVRGHPHHVGLGLVGKSSGTQGLRHRQVGVRQVDVLADQGHRHLVARLADSVEQVFPSRPVDVAEEQAEFLHDVGVQALAVQDLGDEVDRRGIRTGHDGRALDVTHEGDLRLDALAQRALGTADDGVGLDTNLPQGCHGVLGGLGLHLTGRLDVGNQGDVQEKDVLPADLVTNLTGSLEEGQRLDVTHGAADLMDDDVGVTLLHRQHAFLDLVGDVRNDLDRVAQVVTTTFLGDHGGVDLAGGDVGLARQVLIEESLVVADVQVGLGTVLGDEDLTMLERVHRSRIDVEVGVQLLHRDLEATSLEKRPEGGGREPLSQGGDDSSGDENVLAGVIVGAHGPPA